MKRLIFLLCALFVYPAIINAQYSVDTNLTVNQYVEKLLGPGIEFSNAHIYGDRQAIGYFTGAGDMLSIDKGVILTSGKAANSNNIFLKNESSSTNNGLSDIPELSSQLIDCNDVRDGLELKFTFKPQNPTITFKYIFASEEYPEYECSTYNDAFAIYLSGPGIIGEQNIAVIPGTTIPIITNTVNNSDTIISNCVTSNPQYYNSDVPYHLVYDGYTVLMSASANVTPCLSYTIRIMIADGCDGINDSGVFLKALAEPTNIGISANIPVGDSFIYEDCSPVKLTFHNTDTLSSDYVFHYSLSGTAENGTDYTTIPDSIIILAGTNSTEIDLSAFQDNQTEGIETITFSYQTVCGDFVSEFQISDQPPLEIVQDPIEVVCAGKGPVQLRANLIQGVPPYT